MHTYFDLYSKRALIILAFAAVPVLPLRAQVGLGLTPMRMEFAAEAGRQYSGSLTLSNSSDSRTRARTQLLDFYVDGNSTPQFVPNAAQESAYSCREWLTVNPMEMEVPPRGQVQVRYSLRVPAEASPQSHHCAIGFLSMPPPEEAVGIGVRTAVRVVSVIYPIVGKPPVAGEIAELKLEPTISGSATGWRGVVVMQNSGPMMYRPSGDLEVWGPDGNMVESLKMMSFPVLPRRNQRFLMPLKNNLAPGRYTLRAKVDIGPEIQEASAVVTAEPRHPPPQE
jgi:hypothetical protein